MTFVSERKVGAVRKARPCVGCNQRIEAGEQAITWAGMTEGDFGAVTYHPECRAAEIRLNDLAGTFADEWIALRDRDREDDAWIADEFPVVAARLEQSHD
jgi:hypothetical protein